jgi:hypothetical protein
MSTSKNVVKEQRILSPIKLDVTNDPHPIIGNPVLPRGMWLSTIISPRNGGKTHLICQLVRRMEEAGYRDPVHGFKKVPIRTILLSPTSEANPVFKSLKSLDKSDILHNFSFKAFDQIWDNVKFEKEAAEKYLLLKDIYDRKAAGEMISTREESIIHNLFGEEPQPEGRYTVPPVSIIIADDLANSPAYKLGSTNSFVNACIRNRHNRTCIAMAVQHAKSIPRVLRQNISLLAIGKFADSSYGLSDLYEFCSSFLKEDEFQALYEQATSVDHGFLCLDVDSKRVTRNFENQLSYSQSALSPL